MASIFSRVGDILKKNFQNTNTGFNKIIYNYLGQLAGGWCACYIYCAISSIQFSSVLYVHARVCVGCVCCVGVHFT